MKILETMEKIPGGLVVVPMLTTAVINTAFPQALAIGGVTTALFRDGTFAILGLLLFFSGCQLNIRQLGAAMKRGGVMIAVKLLVAFAAGFFLMTVFGPEGFWGISTVALVTAISNNKPAVYLALVQKYGDKIDEAVFGLLCLTSMPILPLSVLGLSSGGVDPNDLITLLIPFILGFAVANLDQKLAALMAPGTVIMLPFIGFCFGASINLLDAVRSAPHGILLLLIYTLVTVPPQLLADRVLLKRPGYAAIASCTIGGTVLVIPAMVAKAIPVHAPYVDTAVAQLAFAMTFSCLLTPFLTKCWVGFCRRHDRSV